MAQIIGRHRRVSDIIDEATRQGCVVRVSTVRLITPDGDRTIRYLYNPANKGRFEITDYADGEYMVQSEWEACVRRLGIILPHVC